MKPHDLIPFKVVAQELGVSRATLWRARMSGIRDFPAPIIRARFVYWRRRDLEKLEDALFQYQGRVVFERERERTRKTAALKRAKAKAQSKAPRRSFRRRPGQADLFER